jgi:hypothetical protein
MIATHLPKNLDNAVLRSATRYVYTLIDLLHNLGFAKLSSSEESSYDRFLKWHKELGHPKIALKQFSEKVAP